MDFAGPTLKGAVCYLIFVVINYWCHMYIQVYSQSADIYSYSSMRTKNEKNYFSPKNENHKILIFPKLDTIKNID